MSSYQIKRWDALTGDNIQIRPAIYIEPDETFLTFVQANQFSVLCEISGTGTNYDYDPKSAQKIPGFVSKSSDVPNCRPNYFVKNGYYIITLLVPWMGYPNKDSLGTVKFYGLEAGTPDQVKELEKPEKKDIAKKDVTKNAQKLDMSSPKFYWAIALGVFLLLVGIIFTIWMGRSKH